MLMESASAAAGNIEIMFLRQRGDDPFIATPERTAQIVEVANRIARFISEANRTLDIAIYDFRLHDEAATIITNALRGRATNNVVIRNHLRCNHRAGWRYRAHRFTRAARGGQEGAGHGDFRSLIRGNRADKRCHWLSRVDA